MKEFKCSICDKKLEPIFTDMYEDEHYFIKVISICKCGQADERYYPSLKTLEDWRRKYPFSNLLLDNDIREYTQYIKWSRKKKLEQLQKIIK